MRPGVLPVFKRSATPRTRRGVIMVFGVGGHLGGGKSASTVSRMLRHLASGQPVVSNIELIPDKVDVWLGVTARKLDWRTLYHHLDLGLDCKGHTTVAGADDNPWDWPQGPRRGSGASWRVMVAIDESAEWLDAYLPGSTGRVEDICGWLRHSDKRGQDVHLIIQHPRLLHKRAAQLVHRWWICTDMSKFHVPGLAMTTPPPLNRLIYCKLMESDARTPIQGAGEWIAKEPDMLACYDTAATFGAAATHGGGVVGKRTAVRRKADVLGSVFDAAAWVLRSHRLLVPQMTVFRSVSNPARVTHLPPCPSIQSCGRFPRSSQSGMPEQSPAM